jgi:2-methylisocitrate lyase-like PEP mutase family enzyme
MSQVEKAKYFAGLHVKGAPVVLYNAWDAGSAKAIVTGGAKAVATSSWAVAAAQGFGDGEETPLAYVYDVARRITGTVDVPVSIDFEGGYSEDEAGLAENVTRLLETGIVGINFEDRVVRGDGLYPIERQGRRIAAVRAAADRAGVPLFINARTDLFLGRGTPDPADSIDAAIERATAYAAAGASGFFIPGLTDEALIARICERVELPVNVMMMTGAPSVTQLGQLGVARVSYGGIPYAEAMAELERAAAKMVG